MNEYCKDLSFIYQLTISEIERVYPLCDAEFLKQIDNYSRACALYLWNAFDIELPQCVEAINAIYSKKAGMVEYTEMNVQAAMEKLSSHNYSMPVPPFFYDIINYDLIYGSNISRRLAAAFQILDIAYAMIDGIVQAEEAETIDRLQRELFKACDDNNIISYNNIVNPHQYVKDSEDVKLFVSTSEYDEINVTNNSLLKKEDDIVTKKDRNKSKSIKSAVDELENLVGLSKAKNEIHEICDFAKVQKAREEQGLPTSNVSFHLVFTGNPGTGKTTVARLVAEIYKDIGIVSKGHLTEVSAKDLVAGYVGQTAIKTAEVINKALGGVLFIDEAYALLDSTGQGYGQEAIDTLLKEMEDNRDDFAVIIAGYDDLIDGFINSNPGLKSRFNKYVHFDDYSSDEMFEIFDKLCKERAYSASDKACELIKHYFNVICDSKDESFANGRTVRNVFESIISKQATRIASSDNKTKELLSIIEVEDVQNCIDISLDSDNLEDALDQLNSLIGLEKVKEEIGELIYIVQNQQRRKAQGLKVPSLSLHIVFTGNPGTGKTTVARCVAKIYKCLGLLSKGQLIEVDRSGLVAGYVGQTAIKTQEVIKSAVGGVLFIDEAYTLVCGQGNDFGQEAIDTLLEAMEDQRDDMVVIVAGYDDLMKEFIESNPGLESRFNRYIHFDDYSSIQMFTIFDNICKNNQYILSSEATEQLKEYFDEINSAEIGNGRGVRNMFERVITQQAKRIECLSVDSTDLQEIIGNDITMVLKKG